MTSAFSHMVRGEVVAAISAQIAGALFAVFVAAGAVGGLWMAVSGRLIRFPTGWLARWPGLAMLGGVFFGAWAVKIVMVLLRSRGGS